MAVKAVIFDLDGVIVSTDEYHYQGWKRMADEEGIYFDRQINQRLRGISRMASLDIVLESAVKKYTMAQKRRLAEIKNAYYKELLQNLRPENILPGVNKLLKRLKNRDIKIVVASSSKNCLTILKRIGLSNYFDAVVDGNNITHSKPHPEIFLLAAKRVGVLPEKCIVVEDAEAGVTAALDGGMKVIGVGYASGDKRATYRASDLVKVSVF